MSLHSCDSTPPIACLLASIVTIKGFQNFGKARIGALLRVSFRIWKASCVDKVHTNSLAFLRVAMIGEAICA